MMNYELLGTIWEHNKKKWKRGRGGEGQILLNLEPCPLGKDIAFVV
jgi:hypothetical protein